MEKTLPKLNLDKPISLKLIDLSEHTGYKLEKEYLEEISLLQNQLIEAPKALIDKLLRSLQKEYPQFNKKKI